ncbi:MAG: type III secretion HpaP family protein [Planctomycetota bacterium]
MKSRPSSQAPTVKIPRLQQGVVPTSPAMSSDEEAVAQFEELLGGKDRNQENKSSQNGEKSKEDGGSDKDGENSDGENSPKPKPESKSGVEFTPGDAILRSIQTSNAEASSTQSVGKSDSLDGLVHEIAEKLMVSSSSQGDREVRIQLKQNVLAGTEVRIAKRAGALQIQFHVQSTEAQNFLHQQVDQIQRKLSERLSSQEVLVSVESDSSQQESSQDGRSRGNPFWLHDEANED